MLTSCDEVLTKVVKKKFEAFDEQIESVKSVHPNLKIETWLLKE